MTISNSTQNLLVTNVALFDPTLPYAKGQLVLGSDNNTYYATKALTPGQPDPLTAGNFWSAISKTVPNGTPLVSWAPNTTYNAGSVVLGPDNNMYVMNGGVDNTKTTFLTGVMGTAGYWTQLNCPAPYQNATPTTWDGTASGPAYVKGQTVTNSGVVYVANGNIVAATATFPIVASGSTGSNWTAVSQNLTIGATGTVNLYANGTAYTAGQQVLGTDGYVYIANSAFTSTGFLTATLGTANRFTQIGVPVGTATGAGTYQTGVAYNVNDTVKFSDGNIYKCTAAITNSGTFDITKWTNITSPEPVPVISRYAAANYYQAGNIVIGVLGASDNNLYIANSNFAANAAVQTGVMGTANTWTQLNTPPGTQTIASVWSNLASTYSLGQTVMYSVGNSAFTDSSVWSANGSTTQGTFKTSEWTRVSPIVGAAVQTWDSRNSYVAGQQVLNSGDSNIYFANANIDPGTPWAVGSSGQSWQILDGAVATPWTLAFGYTTGELVVKSGLVYRANSTINANTAWAIGSSSTTGTWSQVSVSVPTSANAYVTSSYPVGSIVAYTDGYLYQANTVTTATSWVPSEWTMLLQPAAPGLARVWNSNLSYIDGQLVLDSSATGFGNLFRANGFIASGTAWATGTLGTAGTFTQLNVPSGTQTISAPAFSTSGKYIQGQTVTYNGNIYAAKVSMDGTSVALTWVPANWTQVSPTAGSSSIILLSAWSQPSSYQAGQLVLGADGFVYMANSAIAANTPWATGLAGTANTFTQLTGLSTPNAATWLGAASPAYVPNQTVKQTSTDNIVYKANAGGVAANTVTFTIDNSATPAANTWSVSNVYSTVVPVPYIGKVSYVAGSLVIWTDGNTYRANSYIPSTATAFVTGVTGTANTWTQINVSNSSVYQTGAVPYSTYAANYVFNQGQTVLSADGNVYKCVPATFTNTAQVDPFIAATGGDNTNWISVSPSQSLTQYVRYGASLTKGQPVMIKADSTKGYQATAYPLNSSITGTPLAPAASSAFVSNTTTLSGNANTQYGGVVALTSGLTGSASFATINQSTATNSPQVINFVQSTGIPTTTFASVTTSFGYATYLESAVAVGKGLVMITTNNGTGANTVLSYVTRDETGTGIVSITLNSAPISKTNIYSGRVVPIGTNKVLVLLLGCGGGDYQYCTFTYGGTTAAPTLVYDNNLTTLPTATMVPSSASNGGTLPGVMISVDSNRAIFFRRSVPLATVGYTYAHVVTVSGTTITEASAQVVDNITTDNFVQIAAATLDPANGYIAFMGRPASGNTTLRILTLNSGNIISKGFGDTVTGMLPQGSSTYCGYFNLYVLNNRTMFISMNSSSTVQTIGSTNKQYVNFDPTNIASPITVGSLASSATTTEYTASNNSTTLNTGAFNTVSNTLLINYPNGGAPSIIVNSLYNFTGTGFSVNGSAFAGIAQVTGGAETVGPIVFGGVSPVHVGLTPGAAYFVDYSTGSYTTNYSPVTIGRAITSTQLMVEPVANQTASAYVITGTNPTITAFSSSLGYAAGALVRYTDGVIYMANSQIAASPSFVTGTFGTIGTWTPISITPNGATTAQPWQLNYAGGYSAGNTVKYIDGNVYYANAAITSGTPFVVGTTGATWTLLTSANTIPSWQLSATYPVGQLVTYTDGQVYRSVNTVNANTPWSLTNWRLVGDALFEEYIAVPSVPTASTTSTTIIGNVAPTFVGGATSYIGGAVGQNTIPAKQGYITRVAASVDTANIQVGVAAVSVSSGKVLRTSTTASSSASTTSALTWYALPSPFYLDCTSEYLVLYFPMNTTTGFKIFTNSNTTVTNGIFSNVGTFVMNSTALTPGVMPNIPWSYELQYVSGATNVSTYATTGGLSYQAGDLVMYSDGNMYRATAYIAPGSAIPGVAGSLWTKVDAAVPSLFSSRALNSGDNGDILTIIDESTTTNNLLTSPYALNNAAWTNPGVGVGGSTSLTYTSGTNTATVTGATTVVPGMKLTGSNIPANTYIMSFVPSTSGSAGTITLSQNPSASGTQSVTLPTPVTQQAGAFTAYGATWTSGGYSIVLATPLPSTVVGLNVISGASFAANTTVTAISADGLTLTIGAATLAASSGAVVTFGALPQVAVFSAVTYSVTTTTGNANITLPNTANMFDLMNGFVANTISVAGPGIPAGTTISSITGAGVITMSNNATASASVTVTLGIADPIGNVDPNGNATLKANRVTFASGGYLQQSFNVQPTNSYEISVWVRKSASSTAPANAVWLVSGTIGKYVSLTNYWQKVVFPTTSGTNSFKIGGVDNNGVSDITCYGAVDIYYPNMVSAQTATIPATLPVGFTTTIYGPVNFTAGAANATANGGTGVDIRDLRVYNPQGYNIAYVTSSSASLNDYVITGQTAFQTVTTGQMVPATQSTYTTWGTDVSSTAINFNSSAGVPVGAVMNSVNYPIGTTLTAISSAVAGTVTKAPINNTGTKYTTVFDNPGQGGTVPTPPSPDHVLTGAGWKRGNPTLIAANYASFTDLVTAINNCWQTEVTVDFTGCRDMPVQPVGSTYKPDLYVNKSVYFNNCSGTSIYQYSCNVVATATWTVGTPAQTTTFTLSSGSTTLTAGSTTNIQLGASVTGTGIPEGTYVTALPSGTTITLNQSPTTSGAQSLTFSNNVIALSGGSYDITPGCTITGAGINARIISVANGTGIQVNTYPSVAGTNVKVLIQGTGGSAPQWNTTTTFIAGQRVGYADGRAYRAVSTGTQATFNVGTGANQFARDAGTITFTQTARIDGLRFSTGDGVIFNGSYSRITSCVFDDCRAYFGASFSTAYNCIFNAYQDSGLYGPGFANTDYSTWAGTAVLNTIYVGPDGAHYKCTTAYSGAVWDSSKFSRLDAPGLLNTSANTTVEGCFFYLYMNQSTNQVIHLVPGASQIIRNNRIYTGAYSLGNSLRGVYVVIGSGYSDSTTLPCFSVSNNYIIVPYKSAVIAFPGTAGKWFSSIMNNYYEGSNLTTAIGVGSWGLTLNCVHGVAIYGNTFTNLGYNGLQILGSYSGPCITNNRIIANTAFTSNVTCLSIYSGGNTIVNNNYLYMSNSSAVQTGTAAIAIDGTSASKSTNTMLINNYILTDSTAMNISTGISISANCSNVNITGTTWSNQSKWTTPIASTGTGTTGTSDTAISW